MINPLKLLFRWIARKLAATGLIDEERGVRTADLSWPRMITGFARLAKRTADVAMVGLVLGPAAIAGLALGYLYYDLASRLALGLAGGTINQASQRYGAGKLDELDLAFKQSIWISLALALPFAVVFWTVPAELVSLFGVDQTTTDYGAIYLQVLAIAVVPNFMNSISSRVLAGADDTWIPMSIRSTAAFLNIGLNAVFIFGLGYGVMGAALGTVIADLFVMTCFGLGFTGTRLPLIGDFPVHLTLSGPYYDANLSRDLVKIATPLMLRRTSQAVSRFPLYAILATFGPVVIAAYEVARRVQRQMNAPSWGFSVSAGSLVGQALGRGDEAEAELFAWDIIRFSTVVYVVGVVFLLVFARPVGTLFVQDPSALDQTVPFIRAGGIALMARGIERTVTGVLQGTGDTTWPFYGQLVGLYLFMIPLAYLGTVTSLGLWGLYLAFVAESFVPAAIVFYRFHSGTWKTISREYRPEQTTD